MKQEYFQKGASSTLEYPLLQVPENSAGLSDPRVGVQHNVFEPLRPGDATFEDQVALFKSCRDSVARGMWPNAYLNAHIGSDYFDEINAPNIDQIITSLPRVFDMMVDKHDPESAADIVHMDSPNDLGQYLFKFLWGEGVRCRDVEDHHKYGAHNYFLAAYTRFNRFLEAELADCYDLFMESKYYFGLVRPEEYFELPGCIVTTYKEGCPTHPAYPAGHGTFAGRTWRTLKRFLKLEDQPLSLQAEAWLACWLFAHFRTFAGVHWSQDNNAGLLLGARD